MTDEQRGILLHSLGLNRSKVTYRNYFCADESHDDMPIINSLIGLGYMRPSHKINQGRDTIYVVTDAGIAALGTV